MTANGGVASAVEAMRLCATDYLVKPFDAGEWPLVIARAQRTRNTARLEEPRRGDTARQSSPLLCPVRRLVGAEGFEPPTYSV